jgi:N-formylglutamate deformylase
MSAPPVFELKQGSAPLLVSLPHCGTALPAELVPRLVPRAQALEDTDWHLAQLYGFVRGLGASLIVPTWSRYLIDLNRPPDNAPMYAGANTTGLCPERLFSGDALYLAGQAPGAAEIERRRRDFWQPYHDALDAELARLRSAHGHALLLDGHSIRSELPWLFRGRLPDLNLGTVDGVSCAPSLRKRLARWLSGLAGYTQVIDGRFKGGYITRRYGRPHEGVHAVQLEMCWSCYMDESPPYSVDPMRAARLAPVLRALVDHLLAWRPLDE